MQVGSEETHRIKAVDMTSPSERQQKQFRFIKLHLVAGEPGNVMG